MFLKMIFISMLAVNIALASPLRIAVASNFATTLGKISDEYKKEHQVEIELVAASTGKLYAMIKNGAPFDLFFSADLIRPQKLVELGLAKYLKIYARGKLAFWAPKLQKRDELLASIQDPSIKALSIAHSTHAPYGQAAMEVIHNLSLKKRMIMGENISQAFHYVKLGNTQAGFVSYSQLIDQKIDSNEYILEISK